MDLYDLPLILNVGDIVVDPVSCEIGLLMKLVPLLDESYTINKMPNINAWEIWWTGKIINNSNIRTQTYTENGLINMIREGLLIHYKNN